MVLITETGVIQRLKQKISAKIKREWNLISLLWMGRDFGIEVELLFLG